MTNEYRYFLESNLLKVKRLFVLVFLNAGNDAKRYSALNYYLPKGIIKNYNVIINEKNFYNQAIDYDIRRYEEKRKLTTGQGKDYTTGCLLDYEYIKSNYRLIAVGLNRERIWYWSKSNWANRICLVVKKMLPMQFLLVRICLS